MSLNCVTWAPLCHHQCCRMWSMLVMTTSSHHLIISVCVTSDLCSGAPGGSHQRKTTGGNNLGLERFNGRTRRTGTVNQRVYPDGKNWPKQITFFKFFTWKENATQTGHLGFFFFLPRWKTSAHSLSDFGPVWPKFQSACCVSRTLDLCNVTAATGSNCVYEWVQRSEEAHEEN